MKIFVTGGTGFLGAHLLYHLVNKGYDVYALKRKNSNINRCLKIFSYYNESYNNLFNKINWLEGDVTNCGSFVDYLEDIDYVYHCAAMVTFNKKRANEMIENNINGTSNIVNACLRHNVPKLCHISSIAALGDDNNEQFITEKTLRKPKNANTAYSISKFQSEMEIWRGIEEGLNAVIVNPSVILGEDNWKSGSSKIFSTVNKGLKHYTSGITGFIDVQDVVKACMLLTESNISNQRYILSADNLSYKNLFTKIAVRLNKKTPKKEVNKKILLIASFLNGIFSTISGKEPIITKDIVKSAYNQSFYSSEKIIKELNFSFNPIDETINRITKNLLKDNI